MISTGPTTEAMIERNRNNITSTEIKKFSYYFFYTYLPRENYPVVRWGQILEYDTNGRIISHDYTSGEKWIGTPAYILEETCKYGHPHLWHEGRKEKICPWCDIE